MSQENLLKSDAPEGATHYRLNEKGVARYYRLDCNNDWIVFQDWQYPLVWRKTRKIDNILPINAVDSTQPATHYL